MMPGARTKLTNYPSEHQIVCRYVTQALSSWRDLTVEKVLGGYLSKDTEKITKAIKRHIKNLA
jgi:hypothetical protein